MWVTIRLLKIFVFSVAAGEKVGLEVTFLFNFYFHITICHSLLYNS